MEGTQNSFVPAKHRQRIPILADIYSVAPALLRDFGHPHDRGRRLPPRHSRRGHRHRQPGAGRQGISRTKPCRAAHLVLGPERSHRRPGGHHQIPHHRRRAPSLPLLPDCPGPARQRFAHRHHARRCAPGAIRPLTRPTVRQAIRADRSGARGLRRPNHGDADLAGDVPPRAAAVLSGWPGSWDCSSPPSASTG